MLQDSLESLLVVLPVGCPVADPDAHVHDDSVRNCIELAQLFQSKQQRLYPSLQERKCRSQGPGRLSFRACISQDRCLSLPHLNVGGIVVHQLVRYAYKVAFFGAVESGEVLHEQGDFR